MRIIVDGYGGDNAPDEVIKGCREAADEYGIDITVTGNEDALRNTAEKCGVSLTGIKILAADSVLKMGDSPRNVVKMEDSSMNVGLRELKNGEGDAFVSAGNTGALLIGSVHLLGRINGIKRPALAPIMPSSSGCFMLIDGGANATSTPQMLSQFALMGSIYMSKIAGVEKPRIGLVNIGSEETKGTVTQRETFSALRASTLNFIGNVEGRDIPAGVCDVIVADGFTGNVILKFAEGLGISFVGALRDMLTKDLKSKFAAMLLMNGLRAFKKKYDYTEYGGAPLMGISKPVIKAHGSSNAKAFKNAIRQAVAFVREGVIGEIEETLPAYENGEKSEKIL